MLYLKLNALYSYKTNLNLLFSKVKLTLLPTLFHYSVTVLLRVTTLLCRKRVSLDGVMGVMCLIGTSAAPVARRRLRFVT